MLDLINTFSITEIITFLVLGSIAIKEVIEFVDWIKGKIKNQFEKTHDNEEGLISIKELSEQINKISAQIAILMESDKDDIKSFITKEHHYFCYDKGWIDDYSLDCIERRFKHYQDEGGNSFVEALMKEIRSLPRQPQK